MLSVLESLAGVLQVPFTRQQALAGRLCPRG